ncbi:MAG: CPBP family intramembrane metalloprotease [Prevotellaceae bacterium]|jgi:membrane protease YdiL (CAAX protease family)|nr:CPBP family intramembrane metalloprotease [Prevotellaceae bacterium]
MNNDNIKYPNLMQTTTLFVAFLIISLILTLTVRLINGESKSEWLTLLTYVAMMSLTILCAKKFARTSGFDFGVVASPAPDWLFWLLVPTTLSLFLMVDRIVGLIPMPQSVEEMFAEMVSPSLPSFLTVVIAAPVLEELLCRGIVLRGLLNNMSPYKAILWSALFFALLHLNPWQGVAAFIIGFFSGWIFWKTRSVVPCMFIHLLNNGTAFLILMLAGKQSEPVTLVRLIGFLYYLLVSAAILIGTACIVILYHKYEPNSIFRSQPNDQLNDQPNDQQKNQ